MDGRGIIRHLLVSHSPITALINPNELPPRISADVLGQGVKLPAYRIERITGDDFEVITRGPVRRVTQRIQVTSLGPNVTVAESLHKMARRACDEKRLVQLGDLTMVDVRTDGEGIAGIDGQTLARAETQDFRVSYNEPT